MIEEAFHGVDLVLLDCGQYKPRWAFIHLLTPRIGEPMAPDDNPSRVSRWWEAEASYR